MLNAPLRIKLTQQGEVEQHQSEGELHVVAPKVAVEQTAAHGIADPNLEADPPACFPVAHPILPEIHFPPVVALSQISADLPMLLFGD